MFRIIFNFFALGKPHIRVEGSSEDCGVELSRQTGASLCVIVVCEVQSEERLGLSDN